MAAIPAIPSGGRSSLQPVHEPLHHRGALARAALQQQMRSLYLDELRRRKRANHELGRRARHHVVSARAQHQRWNPNPGERLHLIDRQDGSDPMSQNRLADGSGRQRALPSSSLGRPRSPHEWRSRPTRHRLDWNTAHPGCNPPEQWVGIARKGHAQDYPDQSLRRIRSQANRNRPREGFAEDHEPPVPGQRLSHQRLELRIAQWLMCWIGDDLRVDARSKGLHERAKQYSRAVQAGQQDQGGWCSIIRQSARRP